MPALATISGNIVVEPNERNKSPKRTTRSAIVLEESPNICNSIKPAVRRSRRRRKSTVYGLENTAPILLDSSTNLGVESPPPSAVRRSRRRRKSTVHGLGNILSNPMNQHQQEQTDEETRWNDVGQDSLPSPLNRGSSTDENEAGFDGINANTNHADALGAMEMEVPSSNTMEVPSDGTPATDYSQLPSSANCHEAKLATLPIENVDRARIPSKTEPSSDVTCDEALSPTSPKSRLSLLLTLRPPPSKPKSILRRRCISTGENPSHDGTEREELTESPTSNRHFDPLATFEALSSMPQTETAFQTTASGDEILVINLETLQARMQVLFPEKYPHHSEMVSTKRRGRSASIDKQSQPPCILPRLVACYTIYRDCQWEQNNDGERKRSPKRLKLMDGMLETETPYSEAVESLSPVRDLLQKLVDLEWITLKGHEHRNGDEGLSTTFKPPRPSMKAKFASCWKMPQKKENFGVHKRRRIQFASSVVRAPSDVLEDSHRPQEMSIQALLTLLDAVKKVFPKAISSFPTKLAQDAKDQLASSDATTILNDFIFYLKHEFISQYHDTLCVESFMATEKQNIPISRVQKVAAVYSREMASLINPEGQTLKQVLASANAIEGSSYDDRVVVPLSIQTTDVFVRSAPLIWECRLANTSAQLIRYWLRTLMNENNERVDFDTKTDQWKMRISDYVQLTEVPEEKELNTKLNELTTTYDRCEAERSISIDQDIYIGEDADTGSLSFLLSNALTHIYGYLQLGSDQSTWFEKDISWKNRLLKVMPDENCCATTVCQDGFGTTRKPVYLIEDDWQDLREQLEAASFFCAFHRRALFVERLLSIVEYLGISDYWTNTVQVAAAKLAGMEDSMKNSNRYAICSEKPVSNICNLDGNERSSSDSIGAAVRAVQPEDVHLVLLAMPPNELLLRLRTEILPLTCRRYEVCRANLRKTEQKFRLGRSNTAAKKKFLPEIAALERYWEHSLYEDTKFPSISLE